MIANRVIFLFAGVLFSAQIMAQKPFNYTNAWAAIDSLIAKELPKSAMQQVDKLYLQAKKDKEEAQLIKAVTCKAYLTKELNEDEWKKSIAFLEKEIQTAKEPAKQILNSITADLYWEYFQNQRWKIYDRKQTTTKTSNPDTWSIPDFHAKIWSLYEASLQSPALLQKTGLEKYDPILAKGNVRFLRPSLYDILAHRVLDYLDNDESDISKPIDAFVLNDYASLANAKIFSRYEYKTNDSSSHTFRSIQLYQQLIRFHLEDATPDALIDVDMKRLAFAKENSVNEFKSKLYKETVEFIYHRYPTNEQAMQAGAALAEWWKEKGEDYKPGFGNEEDRLALVQAAKLAKEVAAKFPKSEGGISAQNLLRELEKPTLSSEIEKVNVLNEPFRVRVAFKNTRQVYLRLIALPKRSANEENDDDNEIWWKRMTTAKSIRSWTQSLPIMDDMREHSAEIKVDALPQGKYVLLASGQPNFSLDSNALCAASFYVSNISYVSSENQYFILDRNSGKPLAGAKVQLWRYNYDYNARLNVSFKEELLIADKDGLINVKPLATNSGREGNYQLEISYGADYLFTDDSHYRNVEYNNEKVFATQAEWEQKMARYFLFTDRALYRPGQTVFFKAIGITKDKESLEPKIYVPGTNVKAVLYNANQQQVSTLSLKANEYGSVHGEFKLPTSGLTGNYRIEIEGPHERRPAYFKVEEYKRPKFIVAFEPMKGNYRLNDTLTITGKATAYAGNAIDGAKVKYRVYRTTQFLYPWLSKGRGRIWPRYGGDERQEITSGTTLTKADGRFDIVFNALPDLSVRKELDPSFHYEVEADVTDINGETHDANTQVTVGYKSLQLQVNAADGFYQSADSNHHFTAKASNLNNEPTPTPLQWKLYPLQAPTRLLRSRMWDAPDTAVMSRAEFEQTFPHDPFENEEEYTNWPKGNVLKTDTLQSNNSTGIVLPKGSLPAGYYVLETSATDKDGNPVLTKTYFAVYDVAKGLLPAPMYLLDQALLSKIEPGQVAQFLQGSSAQPSFVVQQTTKVQKEKNVSAFEFANLAKPLQPLAFAATEADRGGYSVARFFVQHNRVYQSNWQVEVPWTNKQLDISLETFRNKLLPGQEETWKLKIAGPNKDKAAAELLASMYDASLDQIAPHAWHNIFPWRYNGMNYSWNGRETFNSISSQENYWDVNELPIEKVYDELMAVEYFENRMFVNGEFGKIEEVKIGYILQSGTKDDGIVAAPAAMMVPAPHPQYRKMKSGGFIPDKIEKDEEVKSDQNPAGENNNNAPIQIRKNFNETAFWFPQLQTDAEGNISFSFTMPEALTEWKLQLLAHTKDLKMAMDEQTVITQKELMVQPNAPRFFRQGDQLELVSKVVNLSDKEITGTATLELLNASTMQPVDGWLMNVFPQQYFTVPAGQSVAVKFPMAIPVQYTDALVYRITARAGNLSDGEEMALPVLSNRMLVTETLPINLRNTNKKEVRWEKLLQSENSPTLQHQSLTIEFTSNPVWLAIQSLPYLTEYPYDCAEQTWNRFYANALAAHIANSMPKIKTVIAQWQTKDTAALLSNLQKNEQLKSILLEETPWVLAAKSEAEQKKQLAQLFEVMRMAEAAEKDLKKLEALQSPNGGFVWFKGGADDRYMTQYILSGIGHLNKLKALPKELTNRVNNLAAKAIPYLDARITEDYNWLIKNKADLKKNHTGEFAIQYLYMRSFFPSVVMKPADKKAYDFYFNNAKTFYTNRGKQSQGMIALAMHRSKQTAVANAILKTLKETSITTEEFGMYWKEFNNPSYYWWQAPIESHSLLIEAFAEIENNTARVNDLKTWLLKQKQTTNWKTTKATAEACYALLLQGSHWLQANQTVAIQAGNWQVESNNAEAGTGYFSSTLPGEKVKPEMGNISVRIKPDDKQPAEGLTTWGAAYWQYFEDLDKITAASTGLQLQKTLMLEISGANGPKLQPITSETPLKPGDKVVVRITVTTDRQLEYVHLKDMRAACFEPTNQLSQYHWQGGLGYYQAPKDASMNFFIGYLPKGTWVLDYTLLVTHEGEFSNGISSIQCMYAPEFSSHSSGERIVVKNN